MKPSAQKEILSILKEIPVGATLHRREFPIGHTASAVLCELCRLGIIVSFREPGISYMFYTKLRDYQATSLVTRGKKIERAQRLLETLKWRGGWTSRATLVKLTGLSLTTVTKYMLCLLTYELVRANLSDEDDDGSVRTGTPIWLYTCDEMPTELELLEALSSSYNSKLHNPYYTFLDHCKEKGTLV